MQLVEPHYNAKSEMQDCWYFFTKKKNVKVQSEELEIKCTLE